MQGLDDIIRLALEVGREKTSDFDLNPNLKLPAGRKLRPAAVLIGITSYHETPQIILTKRSSALRHHPGQIAFPGGKVDAGDGSSVIAAQREAREEIGLPETATQVLGQLSTHETVTGFEVSPVIALLHHPFEVKRQADEVAEVFSVPLSHVTELGNYQIQWRRFRDQPRYFYTVPFGPYYIWGATARMLRNFAEILET